MRPFRVWDLRPPSSLIQIANGSGKWIKALFEATIHPLLCFVTEIANVVCCDNGLDVRGQTTTTRGKIQIIRRDKDTDPSISKITKYIFPLRDRLVILFAPNTASHNIATYTSNRKNTMTPIVIIPNGIHHEYSWYR